MIPEDVRDIIESTMRQWAEHWDEYDTSMDGCYSQSAHDDLDAVLAWLDAQPAAPERWGWEPVEDGCHGSVRQRDGSLLLDMGIEEDEAVIRLPDGYALCRRYLRDGEY